MTSDAAPIVATPTQESKKRKKAEEHSKGKRWKTDAERRDAYLSDVASRFHM
jgi:hypothetical protein